MQPAKSSLIGQHQCSHRAARAQLASSHGALESVLQANHTTHTSCYLVKACFVGASAPYLSPSSSLQCFLPSKVCWQLLAICI